MLKPEPGADVPHPSNFTAGFHRSLQHHKEVHV